MHQTDVGDIAMNSLDELSVQGAEIDLTDDQLIETATRAINGVLDPAILAEAVAAIQNSELRGGLSIAGNVVEKSNVIRTRVLTIFNDAVWIFKDIHKYKWIAIAAEEIIIDDGSGYGAATLCRPLGDAADAAYAKLLAGGTGGPGDPGPNGKGLKPNGDGNDGIAGSEGEPGASGKVIDLPPILVFSQSLRLGSKTPPEHQCLEIQVPGIAGGAGGRGGPGGAGGRGAKSRRGVDETFPLPPFCNCKRGPGRSGDGGRGALPGRGGRPGRGGNGGGVHFFAPLSTLDMFKFVTVRQEPGKDGARGEPGLGGLGGQAGPAADGTICCGGGKTGKDRSKTRPTYSDGGRGEPAKGEGRRGDLEYIVRENSDLFQA